MTDLIYYITFFSLTTMVSLYLNGYLNKLFVENKLTDPVNERSSHNYPATRSGGLSIFFTVCIASAFAVATNELYFPLYVLLSVFFMTLTGFADDLIEVRYREKLFLQIFAGILMIQSGYYINSFHGIFGIYDLPYWISVIVSLFFSLKRLSSPAFLILKKRKSPSLTAQKIMAAPSIKLGIL